MELHMTVWRLVTFSNGCTMDSNPFEYVSEYETFVSLPEVKFKFKLS